MAERRMLVGQTGKTGKGTFKVLRETQDGYVIEYISGEWEGKHLKMPKTIGETPSKMRLESLRLSKDEMNRFLDLFYEEFRQEYNHVHYSFKEDIPTTKQMFEALRNEYIPLFQIILGKFFNK